MKFAQVQFSGRVLPPVGHRSDVSVLSTDPECQGKPYAVFCLSIELHGQAVVAKGETASGEPFVVALPFDAMSYAVPLAPVEGKK